MLKANRSEQNTFLRKCREKLSLIEHGMHELWPTKGSVQQMKAMIDDAEDNLQQFI